MSGRKGKEEKRRESPNLAKERRKEEEEEWKEILLLKVEVGQIFFPLPGWLKRSQGEKLIPFIQGIALSSTNNKDCLAVIKPF